MAETIKSTRGDSPWFGHLREGLRESALLLVVIGCFYLLLSLGSFDVRDPAWSHTGNVDAPANLGGVAGAWTADILLFFLGYPAYLVPFLLVGAGWLACRPVDVHGIVYDRILAIRGLGLGLSLFSACGLADLFFYAAPAALPGTGAPGGVLGAFVSARLVALFSPFGATLFLGGLLLTGVNFLTGLSWLGILDAVGVTTLALARRSIGLLKGLSAWFSRLRLRHLERSGAGRPAPESTALAGVAPALEDFEAAPLAERVVEADAAAASAAPRPLGRAADHEALAAAKRPRRPPKPGPGNADRQVELTRLDLPPVDLLDNIRPHSGGYSADVLETLSRKVEEKLADFGIEVRVVHVQPGPVITRFELQPAAGVKVSQITNLAKDLARGLSVIAVRVVEVIPGKSVVGLEIPNQRRELVCLREILASEVYEEAKSPLTLALGKDIGGRSVVTNLGKMPHLLVAGTTGSGKSVAINAMLLSVLYKSTADQVRLILVDPKMLELSIYEGIPHLLAPVVTDMNDAQSALRWCVAEMERRYRLMATLKVRNITGYNRRVNDAIAAGEPLPDPFPGSAGEDGDTAVLTPLPFIVVVIDELADLMMVVGKKVEELIARLAQKARAAGVHLILATQRPSVDVITGLIKANIPSRIAFQVSSKVDSRTILDQMGAETLLGHGDMLFLPPGTAFPQRLHGAFVDDHEVSAVVEYLKTTGQPDYVDAILEGEAAWDSDGSTLDAGDDDAENDPFYDRAVAIVVDTGRASASGIQRRLKIGYNRAARLIEAMERAGIVSEPRTNGLREVLAAPPPEV